MTEKLRCSGYSCPRDLSLGIICIQYSTIVLRGLSYTIQHYRIEGFKRVLHLRVSASFTIQYYHIEGLKGVQQLGPHYTKRREFFGQPNLFFPVLTVGANKKKELQGIFLKHIYAAYFMR